MPQAARRHFVISGSTEGEFETRTLLGREHIVVPVVAMIEGVRFGANQSEAELCLASEFGKFTEGWNNRPVVLGHPAIQEDEGLIFVSAGSAGILEQYYVGVTQATVLSGKKLKMQAWLDTTMKTRSARHEELFNRIESGEAIEVSVGFFTDVEDKKGRFQGEDYHGVWRSIVPDHLAFLPQGVPGACSIADGCGAPRINRASLPTLTMNGDTMSKTATIRSLGMKVSSNPAPKKSKPPEDTTATDSDETVGTVEDEKKGNKDKGGKNKGKANAKNARKGVGAEVAVDAGNLAATSRTQDCGCGGTCGGCSGKAAAPMMPVFEKGKVPALTALQKVQKIAVQKVPDMVISGDVMNALQDAVCDEYPAGFFFVLGYTNETVIFTGYNADWDGDWDTYQMEFDMDADGNVEFTSPPEAVKLMTRIVPASAFDDEVGDDEDNDGGPGQLTDLDVNSNHKEGSMPKANEDDLKNKKRSQADAGGGKGGNGYVGPSGSGGGEGLPGEIGKTSKPGKTKADEIDETVDEDEDEALKVRPAANAKKGSPSDTSTGSGDDDDDDDMATQSRKSLTAQQYIDQAPAEIRDMLQAGMKAQEALKTSIIQALQATKRCHFDVKVLQAKPLDELQNLLALAGGTAPLTQSYLGMAGPIPHANASDVDTTVKVPNRAFARGNIAALQARLRGEKPVAANTNAA